jgi:nicotinamide-nucleotide amidase
MDKKSQKYLKHKVLKTIGLTEYQIKDLLSEMSQGHDLHIKLVSTMPGVNIHITAESRVERIAESLLASAERNIRKQLGDAIYGCSNETMEEVIGYLLYLKKHSLAIAEGCTGGLLSNLISNITGCSLYYKGGIIACDTQAVKTLFGIPEEVIEKYGLVSERVTRDMAKVIINLTKASFGLSITGIMDAQEGDEIGMVWIALCSSNNQVYCKQFYLSGEREEMKLKAAYTAFNILRKELLD